MMVSVYGVCNVKNAFVFRHAVCYSKRIITPSAYQLAVLQLFSALCKALHDKLLIGKLCSTSCTVSLAGL